MTAGTVRYGTERYYMVWYGCYGMEWIGTARYDRIGMKWCYVWYGKVWVWHDMAWHGMVG